MKTVKEIKEHALQQALGHVFTNSGDPENGWPEDPMMYLKNNTNIDVDIVQPCESFEHYDSEDLIDIVNNLASVIEDSMLWAIN